MFSIFCGILFSVPELTGKLTELTEVNRRAVVRACLGQEWY